MYLWVLFFQAEKITLQTFFLFNYNINHYSSFSSSYVLVKKQSEPIETLDLKISGIVHSSTFKYGAYNIITKK